MDSLLIFLLVGLIAGFAASHVVSGHGYGLLGDLIVGVVGAFLGGFLLKFIGIVATGLLSEIIVAFIGAVVLLAIFRLFTGSRYGRRGRVL